MNKLKVFLGVVYGIMALVMTVVLVFTSYFLAKDAITNVSTKFFENKIMSDMTYVQEIFDTTYGDITLNKGTLMSENGIDLGTNYNFVDKISENSNMAVTIFVKDGDDFNRLVTNLKNENGERAVGTMLGIDHPAYTQVINGQDYRGQAELFGNLYETMYHPIFNVNNEIIGILFLGFDDSLITEIALNETSHLLFVLLILIVIITLFAIALSFLIGSRIGTPMQTIKNFAEKIAQGQLQHELKDSCIDNKSEIGALSKAAKQMQVNLRNMIASIQHSSSESAQVSESICTILEETANSINDIASAVESIAFSAVSQSDDLEDGRGYTERLGETLETNHQLCSNMKTMANELESMITEGVAKVETLEETSAIVNNAQDSILTGVKNTNESAEKILVASELIGSISAQTNLLALNASIEAARAGEHGRGFAVVAEEIRKLAEQSQQSNLQIQNVIQELKINSGISVQAAQDATEAINKQIDAVEMTKESFENIRLHLNGVSQQVDKTQESSSTMLNMKVEISTIMTKITTAAQESAAMTQMTNAGIEEVSSALEEIVSEVNQLAQMNKDLNGQTDYFVLA